jgi:hypothetical protein
MSRWPALKDHVTAIEAEDSHALAQVRWVFGRYAGVDAPGWFAPSGDELSEHCTSQFLASCHRPGGERRTDPFDGVTPQRRHQAARRWTSQTAATMRSTDSASSQPPSIHWNGQNRLAGW